MVLVSPGDIDKLYFEDSFEPSIPIFFSVRKNITHDGVLMTVHPVPDRVVTITSVFWTPQEPMEIDGSDDATDFVVPWEPVFAYAYMMALNERGEEMGEAGHLAERRYLAALGAAIEQEISYLGMGDVYEFRRD
jgi:hypothetical protein